MKFNFVKACADMLLELGGEPVEWYTPKFSFTTKAGRMTVTPFDGWAACRFDDAELAVQTIYFGNINPFSGKWNWHFNNADASDVLALREHIKAVQ